MIKNGSIWLHRKSGGKYVLLGQCNIEATNTIAFRYQSIEGGVEWVRPQSEFMDGRFELIAFQHDGFHIALEKENSNG